MGLVNDINGSSTCTEFFNNSIILNVAARAFNYDHRCGIRCAGKMQQMPAFWQKPVSSMLVELPNQESSTYRDLTRDGSTSYTDSKDKGIYTCSVGAHKLHIGIYDTNPGIKLIVGLIL